MHNLFLFFKAFFAHSDVRTLPCTRLFSDRIRTIFRSDPPRGGHFLALFYPVGHQRGLELDCLFYTHVLNFHM